MQVYGLDFGLSWDSNGAVQALLFDWNFSPGMGLQRQSKLTFMREVSLQTGTRV